MRNLTSPFWIKLKGALFLVLGLLASALLLAGHPSLRAALLLAIAVWAFCRFYFFAFHVVQRYVDPAYRFTGLTSFFRYLIAKPPAADQTTHPPVG